MKSFCEKKKKIHLETQQIDLAGMGDDEIDSMSFSGCQSFWLHIVRNRFLIKLLKWSFMNLLHNYKWEFISSKRGFFSRWAKMTGFRFKYQSAFWCLSYFLCCLVVYLQHYSRIRKVGFDTRADVDDCWTRTTVDSIVGIILLEFLFYLK